MTTKIAYLGVIIIWSTTPLAIKWSSEGLGYLFGITSRMLLGLIVTVLIVHFLGLRIPWHRRAVQPYAAGGFGIYAAMNSVYWGAQYIPSGWVSVVFGLSPIITGAMAAAMLNEDALSRHRVLGIVLGFIGLFVVFSHGASKGGKFLCGIVAVLAGTSFHALSAVLIKRIDANVGGFAITAGGLSFAVPLLLVTWMLAGGAMPSEFPLRAVASIVYLGVVASAIGFAMYYYILRRMAVSRVSLIALITPVLALLLGNLLNGERLSAAIFVGTGCIVCGLVIYEFGPNMTARLRNGSSLCRLARSRADR